MKRKYNSFNYKAVVGFIICLSLIIAGNVSAIVFDGGTGEPNNPYLISTPDQLQAIGDSMLYDKYFLLVEDINLDPNIPGNEIIIDRPFIKSFRGTLDGNGYSISNMMIKSYPRDRGGNSSHLGLIGVLLGIVKDIQLRNITILGVSDYVGALVGSNRGLVLRCSVTGSISGEFSIGGLAGDNYGDIVSSSSFCDVRLVPGEMVWVAGGLVGINNGCIYNCYVIGTVTGEKTVGGLIGGNCSNTISQCYAACEIIADSNDSINDSIGGLVGEGLGQFTNSFWDIQVSGQKISAGGIGLPTAKLQDSRTYLSAGWDMADETSNGLADLWMIAEPNKYPQLIRFTDQYTITQLSGSGTKDNPYEIATAKDLVAINDYDINAHYVLVSDIDMSGIVWATAPIFRFNGTLNGQGHTISNLTIKGGDCVGLFAKIRANGIVTNLTIQDVNIIGCDCTGALAGESLGYISDCHVTGSVLGINYVAGLVGSACGHTLEEAVSECTADVALSGNDNIHNIANVHIFD